VFQPNRDIRQIPQTDPDFKALYRRRNDAESINRALDDTLWLRRAHSIGQERQHLNPLTHAWWSTASPSGVTPPAKAILRCPCSRTRRPSDRSSGSGAPTALLR